MAQESRYRANDLARLQPEQGKRAPGKKDTKRWCRGKPGVEHEVETRLERFVTPGECGWYISRRTGKPMWYRCYHEDVCSSCGKILLRTRKQCPDYVAPPGTAE